MTQDQNIPLTERINDLCVEFRQVFSRVEISPQNQNDKHSEGAVWPQKLTSTAIVIAFLSVYRFVPLHWLLSLFPKLFKVLREIRWRGCMV
jgi:hypothetical protein